MIEARVHAARAVRAYTAMERRFGRPDDLYRRSGRRAWPGAAEHLWPTARALVATLDLAGVAPQLTTGFEAEAAIAARLRALERYWDASGPRPAYASDPPGTIWGGDRYYDDNAWVGLALVQLARMRPESGMLERAGELWHFAQGGWDEADGGGVFWAEQGRGAGRRNHDRNTVSTAPNAQLGLHLRELTGNSAHEEISPERLCAWVDANLAAEDLGLYWDKIRSDGSLDQTLWSYNQGSMIGAEVLLQRAHGHEHLARAEGLGRRALDHYAGRLFDQPPAFNAIFFRNLLLLHCATGDDELRGRIRSALGAYAEEAWERRDDQDCLRPKRGPVTLLDQSALVQVLALSAWEPARYTDLA